MTRLYLMSTHFCSFFGQETFFGETGSGLSEIFENWRRLFITFQTKKFLFCFVFRIDNFYWKCFWIYFRRRTSQLKSPGFLLILQVFNQYLAGVSLNWHHYFLYILRITLIKMISMTHIFAFWCISVKFEIFWQVEKHLVQSNFGVIFGTSTLNISCNRLKYVLEQITSIAAIEKIYIMQ